MDMRLKGGTVACAFILLFVLGGCCPAASFFVIVKTGDEAATQEKAAQFLSDFSTYLNGKAPFLKQKPLQGLIANRTDEALALLQKQQPLFALVSPAFFLEHLEKTAAPINQIPRFGLNVEHYYLVAAKSGPASLSALKGKTVRTLVLEEANYLKKVVFPPSFQPGGDFALRQASNMADEVFLMTEKEKGAADALLMDEELLHFFQSDPLVWPALKVLWTSEDLPRDLVVNLDNRLSASEIQQLQKAFAEMPKDPLGSKLIQLMQTSGFVPVNQGLLDRARTRFQTATK